MKLKNSLLIGYGLLSLWLATAPAALAHTHVEIVYREGEMRLLYYDYDYGEYDPAEIVLDVGVVAACPVPDLPAFTNLLGEAGTTTWILPQIQNGGLLWLGVGNESLTSTDFVGNQYLTLLDLEGPGHFALFFNDSFGLPVTAMNSRDGATTNDTLTLPLRSHLHCNWAFSAPGQYRVRLMVSGILRSGNTPITSKPTDYFFAVKAPPCPVIKLSAVSMALVQFEMNAYPGLNYLVETSPNLINWATLTNLHPNDMTMTHTLPLAHTSNCFYRAKLR